MCFGLQGPQYNCKGKSRFSQKLHAAAKVALSIHRLRVACSLLSQQTQKTARYLSHNVQQIFFLFRTGIFLPLKKHEAQVLCHILQEPQ